MQGHVSVTPPDTGEAKLKIREVILELYEEQRGRCNHDPSCVDIPLDKRDATVMAEFSDSSISDGDGAPGAMRNLPKPQQNKISIAVIVCRVAHLIVDPALRDNFGSCMGFNDRQELHMQSPRTVIH